MLSALKGALYFLRLTVSPANLCLQLSSVLCPLRPASYPMLRSLPNMGNMQALQVLPRKYVPSPVYCAHQDTENARIPARPFHGSSNDLQMASRHRLTRCTEQ
jgi:hypothetical protein